MVLSGQMAVEVSVAVSVAVSRQGPGSVQILPAEVAAQVMAVIVVCRQRKLLCCIGTLPSTQLSFWAAGSKTLPAGSRASQLALKPYQ